MTCELDRPRGAETAPLFDRPETLDRAVKLSELVDAAGPRSEQRPECW